MAIKAVTMPAGKPRAPQASRGPRVDVAEERVSFVERHYADELAAWRRTAANARLMGQRAAEPAGLEPADVDADYAVIRAGQQGEREALARTAEQMLNRSRAVRRLAEQAYGAEQERLLARAGAFYAASLAAEEKLRARMRALRS